MKKIIFLALLSFVFACDDSDDFEPKKNEYGTQISLEDRDISPLLGRYFVFRSITAKDTPYDFDEDGNSSFDILAQFPECAIDDSYTFQTILFQTKFVGNQCDPGISPLEGLNDYVITSVDGPNSFFRLIIRNSEDVFQFISIDNLEVFENEERKRTFIGEWTSFNPDFVFDVVMVEIDRPE